jgi:EthD domain-containing protein
LEAYDGLAEVSWDSVDALVAAFGSEEGQRANKALTEDEARFIDLERSSIFLTEEHTFLES